MVSASIEVIRHIIQQCKQPVTLRDNSGSAQGGISTETLTRVLYLLTRLLLTAGETASVPTMGTSDTHTVRLIDDTARASVIWLIGDNHELFKDALPDILRLLCTSLIDEGTESRLQILNLAVKLAVQYTPNQALLAIAYHILEQCRYDPVCDIRDRCRFMTTMLGLLSTSHAESVQEDAAVGNILGTDEGAPPSPLSKIAKSRGYESETAELAEHAMGIMLFPRLPPVTSLGACDIEGRPQFNLASLSSVVGHNISGYQCIPDWTTQPPDSSVRDTESTLAKTNALFSKVTVPSSNSDLAGQLATWSSSGADNSISQTNTAAAADFYGSDSDSSSSDSSSSSDDSSDSASPEQSPAKQNTKQPTSSSDDSSSDDSSSDDSSSSSDDRRKKQTKRRELPARTAVHRKSADATSHPHSHEGQLLEPSDSSYTSISTNNLLGTFMPASQSTANSVSRAYDAFDNLLPESSSSAAAPGRESGSNQNDFLDLTQALSRIHVQTTQPSTSLAQRSPTAMDSAAAAALVAASTAPSASTPVRESETKLLLKPELSNGLSLQANILYNSAPSSGTGAIPFSTLLKLTFRNSGDQPIRRIQISPPSELYAAGKITPNIESIPLLAANGGVEHIMVAMVLTGTGGKTLPFGIRSDKGTYTGLLHIQEWEVLMPLTLPVTTVIALRRTLGGFNQAQATFSANGLCWPASAVSSDKLLYQHITERVQSRTNMTLLSSPITTTEWSQSSTLSTDNTELLFAGLRRTGNTGEGHKVLLSFTVTRSVSDSSADAATGSNFDITIKVNSEDTMLTAALLPILSPVGR